MRRQVVAVGDAGAVPLGDLGLDLAIGEPPELAAEELVLLGEASRVACRVAYRGCPAAANHRATDRLARKTEFA